MTVIKLERKKYMLLANENRTFLMKGKESVILLRALQFTTGLAEDGWRGWLAAFGRVQGLVESEFVDGLTFGISGGILGMGYSLPGQ